MLPASSRARPRPNPLPPQVPESDIAPVEGLPTLESLHAKAPSEEELKVKKGGGRRKKKEKKNRRARRGSARAKGHLSASTLSLSLNRTPRKAMSSA